MLLCESVLPTLIDGQVHWDLFLSTKQLELLDVAQKARFSPHVVTAGAVPMAITFSMMRKLLMVQFLLPT